MKTKLKALKHGEKFLALSQNGYGLCLFELGYSSTHAQALCLNLFTNETEWLFYLDIDDTDTLVYCVHEEDIVKDLIEVYDR